MAKTKRMLAIILLSMAAIFLVGGGYPLQRNICLGRG